MLSLETCQKLKAAGWPQGFDKRGFFKHVDYSDDVTYEEYCGADTGKWVRCPTLEELLEAIQAHIGGELGETKLAYCVNTDKWDAYAYPHNYLTEEKTIFAVADSPSEVAAALWLKLKEAKDA